MFSKIVRLPAAKAFAVTVFAIGAGLAQAVCAAPNHAIDALLAEISQAHPSVLSARAQIEGAKEELDAARMQRWPTLSLSSQARNRSASTNNSTNNSTTTALSVSQPLWTGGALSAGIEVAELTQGHAQVRAQAVRQELAVRTVDTWQSMLASRGEQAVHTAALKLYETYTDMMRRRVDAQVSPRVDLDLLAARSAAANNDVNQANSALAVAQSRLSLMAGREIGAAEFERLSFPVSSAIIRSWAQAQRIDALLARSRSSVNVELARLEVDAAAARLKVSQARLMPTVSLRYQKAVQGGTLDGINRDMIWLEANYSTGAGFSNQALVRAEAAKLDGLHQSIILAERDVREQLRDDWETLQRELELQTTQEAAIRSTKEVAQSYERQFVAGRKSWLDVLNAAREVTFNELRLADSYAIAAGAYYRLRIRTNDLLVVAPEAEKWLN